MQRLLLAIMCAVISSAIAGGVVGQVAVGGDIGMILGGGAGLLVGLVFAVPFAYASRDRSLPRSWLVVFGPSLLAALPHARPDPTVAIPWAALGVVAGCVWCRIYLPRVHESGCAECGHAMLPIQTRCPECGSLRAGAAMCRIPPKLVPRVVWAAVMLLAVPLLSVAIAITPPVGDLSEYSYGELRGLVTDPTSEARVDSAIAELQRRDTDALDRLIHDPEPDVRHQAVHSLRKLANPAADVDLFLSALSDPEARVRLEAALGLVGRVEVTNRERVERAYASESDSEVRYVLGRALGITR